MTKLFSDEVVGKKWTRVGWTKNDYIYFVDGAWKHSLFYVFELHKDDDWIEYIEPKKKRKVTLWRPIRKNICSGMIFVDLADQWKEIKTTNYSFDNVVGWESKEVEVED
jgi:hypothetical protein